MDFSFTFKKLLSIYLNPVTITLELIFLGIVLIGFASRQTRRPQGPKWKRFKAFLGDSGVVLIVLGLVFLFLCSIDPIANALTLALEAKHPPLEERDGRPVVPQAPEFVVVLAGGHLSVEGKPTLSRLTRHALARVVGGVDLWTAFPEAKFVVTGHPKETASMRAVAERLGVPADRIVAETESRDTKDHPVKLAPILGDAPFLLVTSGTHMPRAAALFRSQGLEPVLAPVDFTIWPSAGDYDPYRRGLLVPRPSNVHVTAVALHEWGGLLWSKWRGEVGEEDAAEREDGEVEREGEVEEVVPVAEPVEPLTGE